MMLFSDHFAALSASLGLHALLSNRSLRAQHNFIVGLVKCLCEYSYLSNFFANIVFPMHFEPFLSGHFVEKAILTNCMFTLEIAPFDYKIHPRVALLWP